MPIPLPGCLPSRCAGCKLPYEKNVIAGAGSRGIYSYIMPLTRDYADWAKLCGIYDLNPKRAAEK